MIKKSDGRCPKEFKSPPVSFLQRGWGGPRQVRLQAQKPSASWRWALAPCMGGAFGTCGEGCQWRIQRGHGTMAARLACMMLLRYARLCVCRGAA